MDTFELVLFFTILIGIFLVIYSIIYTKKRNNQSNFEGNYNNGDISKIDSIVKTSLEKLDEEITSFEKYSKSAFEELEQKYNELLFLYNLIDDKKLETASSFNKKDIPVPVDDNIPSNNSNLMNNPKNRDIIQLSKAGLSINEIAKRLGMGQGEVKIVLDLGKAR